MLLIQVRQPSRRTLNSALGSKQKSKKKLISTNLPGMAVKCDWIFDSI